MNDLISRDKAIAETWRETSYSDPANVLTEIRDRLRALPSAEQEIIRCKDCKHYRSYAGIIDGYCDMAEWYGRFQNPNDFCSRAKRRIDE